MDRPQGVYITPVREASAALTKIERVNGDCTVTSIVLTNTEVLYLIDALKEAVC